MQSMTEFFKAGSQSKINTILLRVFILSTLLLVVATWNIQHSSKRMFLPKVLLPSEEKLIIGNKKHLDKIEPIPLKPKRNSEPLYEENKVENNQRFDSYEIQKKPPIIPLDIPLNKDKSEAGEGKGKAGESGGGDKKLDNELIAIGAAAAVSVALAIVGSPVIAVAGVGVAVWGILKMFL